MKVGVDEGENQDCVLIKKKYTVGRRRLLSQDKALQFGVRWH